MEAQQRAAVNNFEGRIASEEDHALRMVGFQGCHLLRAVTVRTIDSTVYCSQLTKLDQAIRTNQNWQIARVLSSTTTTLDPIRH
jgi:hypothetical protein